MVLASRGGGGGGAGAHIKQGSHAKMPKEPDQST